MDEPPVQHRSPEEIAARISRIRHQIIYALNELEAAVAALDDPEPFRRPIKDLRDLLTTLWLSQAILTALLERQHKD